MPTNVQINHGTKGNYLNYASLCKQRLQSTSKSTDSKDKIEFCRKA